jgi:hypothetical protein
MSNLDDYVLNGQSLLDLPSDNAAYVSVKAIIKATGYIHQYPLFLCVKSRS